MNVHELFDLICVIYIFRFLNWKKTVIDLIQAFQWA